MYKVLAVLIVILLLAVGNLHGATPDASVSDSLLCRSSLALSLGFSNGTFSSANVRGGIVRDEVGGFAGSIEFVKWVKEDLAIAFRTGTRVANVDVLVDAGTVSTETALTVPILLGVRYHPSGFKFGEKAHVFTALAAGPYVGIQDKARVASGVLAESRTEMAVGVNVGAGVDWYLSRHLLLGVGFGYHAVTDFREPIGGEKNHSGAEVGVSFGWVF